MNTGTIIALISGITALIAALTGLVTLIVHIVRHDPIPSDNPGNSPAKTRIIAPGATDRPKYKTDYDALDGGLWHYLNPEK